jgi:hypothetical protein
LAYDRAVWIVDGNRRPPIAELKAIAVARDLPLGALGATDDENLGRR